MWVLIGVITWLKGRQGESTGTGDEDLYDGMFFSEAVGLFHGAARVGFSIAYGVSFFFFSARC